MAVPHALVAEALQLPDEEREELLHALLDSFRSDEPAEATLSAEQLAELDASLAEADRGALISADELLARMRRIH